MNRTLKHSFQRFGIGAASLGLAFSVLFPSAVFANSSIESSINAANEHSQHVIPHNYVGALKGSAPVSVIVELANKPVHVYESEAKTRSLPSSVSLQRSKIISEHKSFIASARKVGADIGFEYSDIFNGYSVTLPGNQVEKLLALPGVAAIYPNDEVHTLSSGSATASVTSSYSDSDNLIGADKLHNQGYTGDGVKVAVLDTGIDKNHPVFKDHYKGGYDFVDQDNDPSETAPNVNFPPKDGRPYETSHGTHVSGTILDVAPEVDLYAYRVLGPYGYGTTANIIAAIEQAVSDEADIINLSLGSDFNQSYSATSIAIDNAVKSGVNVVVAAGNAGPDKETLGEPAGAQLALSVGASTTPVNTPFFDIGDVKKIEGTLATYSPDLVSNTAGTKIVYAGVGSPTNYINLDVKDKVVLVDRGALSFGDKSLHAKAAGAKLLLIANNEPEVITPTLGTPGNYIPTYGITQADGKKIKDQLDAAIDTISYYSELEVNQLADFSSIGPGLPDYLIKPDVVAPGVNITSTIPSWNEEYDEAFGVESGTSMAAPHVAGAVALLLSENPDLKPNEMKSLLMNNADPIYARDGKPYSLYQQGAGLINLEKSAKAGSIAKVGETFQNGQLGTAVIPYYTGSLSFGLQPKGVTVTKSVYVEPFKQLAGQTYTLSTEWLAGTDVPNGISIDVNPPASVTSGENQSAQITLNISEHTVDGSYQGILKLSSGTETLRLPYSVVVGDKFNLAPIGLLQLDSPQISPNNDGWSDDTTFTFSVNEDQHGVRFVASPLAAPSTVLGEVYSSDETFYSGLYEIPNWNGTLTDLETSNKSTLPDGHYYITPVLPDGQLDKNQAIIFTIDTEKPLVSGISFAEYEREAPTDPGAAQISGFIDDDLLAYYISTTNPIGNWFTVYAEGKHYDGNTYQFGGVIQNDGSFTIDVPVNEGLNEYKIYVFDYVGNGADSEDYVQRLIYSTGDGPFTVTPKLSASTIDTNKEVTIDLDYSVTDAVYGVYGASFGVVYDNSLPEPKITPSVQLATYQEENFPGTSLTTNSQTYDLGDGHNLTMYSVKLSGGAYHGSGSLGQLTFKPSTAGKYDLELYDVQIWNDATKSTIPSGLRTVRVTVKTPDTPTPTPTPSTDSYVPTATSAPAPGIALKSGKLVETADPAGGKPSAVFNILDTALTASIQNAKDKTSVLDLSDVNFNKYSQVIITLTPAQAEQLKKSEHVLSLKGNGFNVLIPAATLPDFINSNGLALTISLTDTGDTAALTGSSAAINIGSSILTIKNGWTTGKPIILQLNLKASSLLDARKTAAYVESKDHKWSYLQPGSISKEGILQFNVTGDGSYSAASRNVSFKDIGLHWANNDIEVLAAHGIIAGKGTDGSFKPADTLNQAELLTLFDRLLRKGDTWSTRVKESGSRDVLTREEAALIIAKALGADLTVAKISLSFKDADSIAAEARNAVAYAVSNGYLKGVSADSFNPQGTLTRAQAATILSRVLEDLRSKNNI
ncbi:S8 family serine peptidase [Paenibacillus sp. FSL R10-2734]|uniref:S8 family serine peptidase n=1 Tax=Paenibacillus sp. FSL R10-2734 TaxID=2954691 RepID=UPI0030D7E76A